MDIADHANQYLQLWEKEPLTDEEKTTLGDAAAALEALLCGLLMEDSIILNALILINHLRGVEE